MNTDKPTKTASATPEKVREEWRHPITGETREEMHAKRTKYTPQVEAFNGTGKEQPSPARRTPEDAHAESGCTDYLQHPWDSCPENKRTIPAEKPTHTPFPWHTDGSRIFAQLNPGGHKTFIADISADPTISQRTENAKLIVRAVNHAAQLAEALKDLLNDDGEGNPRLGAANALKAYESEVRP